MSNRSIIDSFSEWRRTEESLVLATVFATEGSTYSKPGHRIIISKTGDYRGLVSGGCVEGDLAEHAHRVFETGDACTVTYDLRADEDSIWGMGVGCEGVIRVILQRLDAATDYEPFRTIAERQMTPNGGGSCVTVIESEDEDLRPGATWIDWGDDHLAWKMPADRMAAIRNQSSTLGGIRGPSLLRQPSRGGGFTALHAPIAPVPRVLILGAGLDAAPLVRMAGEIGWLLTIVDHRQARIDEACFALAEHRLCIALQDFPRGIDFDHFAAAVVMSHNLESDGLYLATLKQHANIRYIGLLGPQARRDMLLEQNSLDDPEFVARVRGPAGLEIGANSPESIALSILAEIHQVLELPTDE